VTLGLIFQNPVTFAFGCPARVPNFISIEACFVFLRKEEKKAKNKN